MKSKTINHPSGQRRFAETAKRFMGLRDEHNKASQRMWAGTLALNFTAEELVMLKDYLSPRDQGLLGRIGTFICVHNDVEPDGERVIGLAGWGKKSRKK